jgi:predicted NBD/HSP70 family sugar kinase
MLGLELQDALVLAVSVDDRGQVLARSVVEVSGTLAAAADAALAAVSASDRGPLGLASPNPDSSAIAGVVSGLARRFSAPPPYGPVASGTAAAVAEAWVGAARGTEDVVFFAVGGRTLGGILRQGAAVTGARGRAGSIAWLALNPVEREDYRKIGCLETEVAAAGIVRRLIWRIKAGDRSRVQDTVGNDLTAITMDHVLDAARNGDGVSISVVRDTAKYLGMAAANMVAVVDPETLVLGGIMASAADLLLEPVRVEISRRLPRLMMDALVIAPAALGADAPAMGAARLAATAR